MRNPCEKNHDAQILGVKYPPMNPRPALPDSGAPEKNLGAVF